MFRLAKIIFIITLPLFLLLNAINLIAFDLDYYQAKYKEFDIPKVVKMKESDLILATEKMLSYLLNKSDDIDFKATVKGENVTYFNEKEQVHLKDVKRLIEVGYKIRLVLGIVLLISGVYILILDKNKLFKLTIISIIFVSLLLVILGILVARDFGLWFDYFHMALFTNELWLLDINTDILINMYPIEFFEGITIRITLAFVIELLAVLVFSYFIKIIDIGKRKWV
ncbi:TIGR01906 family membrane protein [Clostridiaceae bacterium M8S5]|nr:TIGR01906 family membrane protein [Clostridiaceae bacterium M8S5]